MDNEETAISKRRITLSAAGVIPVMARVGAEHGVNLTGSLHAKVNLLPFNAWLRAPFESSPARPIDTFRKNHQAAGLAASVLTPRGRDIMAACGQLESVGQQLKKAERRAVQSRQGR
jgi:23S rRNA (adenine2503-C2)-methyltransferase